jgi:MFS family permease
MSLASKRFAALRHPRFRIYLIGQGVGLIGAWCQRIALIWLIYRLTNSAFLLGIFAFAWELPCLLFTAFAGAVADRVNRLRWLAAIQLISAVLSLGLLVIVSIDLTAFPFMVAIAFALGVCQSFELPLRQSFFYEIVDRAEDLPNAVALMAFMNNSGRMVGPLVASFLISIAGEGASFALGAIGYLVVLASLLWIRTSSNILPSHSNRLLIDLVQGVLYAWKTLSIKYSLLMLAIVSLICLPYVVIVPVFAIQVLHGDAVTVGILLSAAGAGAVCGLIWLSLQNGSIRFGRLLGLASCCATSGMIALATSTTIFASALSMTLVGLGIAVTATGTNMFLQSISEDGKRGRVMGLFNTAFVGFAPLGCLIAGFALEKFGCSTALFILGFTGLVLSIYVGRRLVIVI